MSEILLLGPQRLRPTLGTALDSLEVDGAIVAVTAGWQEREDEVEELDAHLGRGTTNLRLYRRSEEVFERDRELFEALRRRQDRLRELQDLYRLRLAHALDAAGELMRRDGDPALLEPERQSALDAVRRLDAHHVGRTLEIHAEFEARWRPGDREEVARRRRELAAVLEEASVLLVAGGHVAVLLNRMRLFDIQTLARGKAVAAWSAGAMALGERVVLFHDSPPHGGGNAEILDTGLGLHRGLVPLPHAKRRLRLGDPVRVASLARRFTPSRCVALDEGAFLRWNGTRWLAAPGVLCLDPDGSLSEMVAR